MSMNKLRPAFRAVVAQWGDASVTVSSPHSAVIQRAISKTNTKPAAILVIGRNRLDPSLFERCAADRLSTFLEANWLVKLIDFGEVGASDNAEAFDLPTPGAIVADALATTNRLRYLVMLTHSRYAINLSELGNDLVAAKPIAGAKPYPSTPIADLRLAGDAAPDGWVDVFGCLCRHDAGWPSELATVLNWPVRTVYPGYSIYFPQEVTEPKSAIPFTRPLFRNGYVERGWAVWLPGSTRPLRVSEPGATARRFDDRFALLEGLLTRIVSRGLEPVRDIRKRRKFAAQARQE